MPTGALDLLGKERPCRANVQPLQVVAYPGKWKLESAVCHAALLGSGKESAGRPIRIQAT